MQFNLPTPLEILLDPISITVLSIYFILILWEELIPARTLPLIKGWRLRGLISMVVFFYLASYLPLIWGSHFVQYRILDLTYLGTAGGVVIGILLLEAGIYFWHRAMHKFNILWRVFHQMHHSAERLDMYGAFYFSPTDMVGWTLLKSLCLTLIFGITSEAATIVILLTNIMAMFQHANIKTPQWLGYLVQRPESYSVHHGRNIHANNYSDLPIYDILFGTFVNPKDFVIETGFYNGASNRIIEMLRFKSVNKPSCNNFEHKNISKAVIE